MPLLTSTKRFSAALPGDAALLYDILTDYDTYSEWLPQIAQSKALATEGDLAIAEFHLRGKKQTRFVVECIHTRNKQVLWRTIEGAVPVAQVEWNLEPAGEGRTQVSLAVTRRFQWSNLFSVAGKLLAPEAALKRLQAQVAAYLPEIAVAGEDGERILELAETEQGVICWIRGKKYILKEESPQTT